MQLPTIDTVTNKCKTLIGTVFNLPKTRNKGDAGLLLERLTGIPMSSACLDCEDGEVKVYPLKQLKDGTIVPKETVAITMMKPEDLATVSWEASRVKKKIDRVLFVGYLRDGDNVTFNNYFLMTATDPKCTKLYQTFKEDYEALQNKWLLEGTITSSTGKLIQSRTKGPGGNAPKTRAFYFRPALIKMLN